MAKTPYSTLAAEASTPTTADTSTIDQPSLDGTDTTTPETAVTATIEIVSETTSEAVPTEQTTQADTQTAATVTVTDRSGITVEKKEPEKNDAAPAVDVTPENANKVVIDALIRHYLIFNDGHVMHNEDSRLRAGHMFREILKYGLDNPDTVVLDSIYAMFKEHNDRVLMPAIIMPTVHAVPKKIADRILCFYTMFKMLVGDATDLNDAVVRNMLGGLDVTKIELIIMYFSNKKSIM